MLVRKVFEFIARYPWDAEKQCPIQTTPIGFVELANEILQELSVHTEYTRRDAEAIQAFDRPHVDDGIEGVDWKAAAATGHISEFPSTSGGVEIAIGGQQALERLREWEARARALVEGQWQEGWGGLAAEALARACGAPAAAEQALRRDAEHWDRARQLRDLEEAERRLQRERLEWLSAKVPPGGRLRVALGAWGGGGGRNRGRARGGAPGGRGRGPGKGARMTGQPKEASRQTLKRTRPLRREAARREFFSQNKNPPMTRRDPERPSNGSALICWGTSATLPPAP